MTHGVGLRLLMTYLLFLPIHSLQDKWKQLDWSDDEVAQAKAKITEAVKKVVPKVNDVQFFMGM